MPYRRLPNTDAARLKALETVLKKGEKTPMSELALSQATLQKARYFLPTFKQALIVYDQTFTNQVQKGKDYTESMRKAKMYVSHFIQVLNLAISRGELKPAVRKHYGLKINEKRMPSLNTENEILQWGENIIKGEAERLQTGGHPITNPTIALVKVRFEDFKRAHQNQKQLQEISNRALGKIAELRQQADQIILSVWNEVESKYLPLEPEKRREKAKEYGVVYVFRQNEKLEFSNINYKALR